MRTKIDPRVSLTFHLLHVRVTWWRYALCEIWNLNNSSVLCCVETA